MNEQKKHTILVAHSNKNFVLGLTIGFSQNGYSISKKTDSGIEALQFILLHQPEVAIIEVELPLLSAFDIIKTARKKEVKTKFVVVFPTTELPILNTLTFTKIHEVYYCYTSVKIVLKVLTRLFYIPKNWLWNLITRKFQEDTNKMIQIMQSLSNDELAVLLNLVDTQQTETHKEAPKTTEKIVNEKLANIELKLKFTNAPLNLREWSFKNITILKAIALRSTT